MSKMRFQTVTQVEIDTDTGKSRIIKSFTTVLGAGMKIKKAPAKELSSTLEMEEM